MKKRRLMLCSIISLIMVFVMAVPMTVSADTATKVKTAEELQAAVNAGGEIVLDANITASITIPKDANVTLDLNGHKLTNAEGNHTVTNNGTLTVKGSGTVDNVSHQKAAVYNAQGATATLNGGKYTRSQEAGKDPKDNGGNSYYNIVNMGNMTINDGVEVSQSGFFSSMIENGWFNGSQNTTKKNAVLTINGGTFDGGLYTIKNDDYGKLNINNGQFTNSCQAVVLNWNETTIEGGSFVVKGSAKEVIANCYDNEDCDKGVVTINGGKFVANKDGKDILFSDLGLPKGSIMINDGTFEGSLDKSADSTIIYGGDFTDDPGKYVDADNYAVLVFEDDDYRVIDNDDLAAGALGAVYKMETASGVTYYYFDEEDADKDSKLETWGHSVAFYAMQHDGTIDADQNDCITVPDKMSVNGFLAALKDAGYQVNGKYYAIADPKAVEGYEFLGWYTANIDWTYPEKPDDFTYNTKEFKYTGVFDFDKKITDDTEVFAAWKKAGSDATEPTQPGNVEKPSQDNGGTTAATDAKADKSAKTGDDFNLFAVGGVALAAIIAMAAVAITGRRHRQR